MSKDFNNICNHGCHEMGKDRCIGCRLFHNSKEKPVTHNNDTKNPNQSEEVANQ